MRSVLGQHVQESRQQRLHWGKLGIEHEIINVSWSTCTVKHGLAASGIPSTAPPLRQTGDRARNNKSQVKHGLNNDNHCSVQCNHLFYTVTSRMQPFCYLSNKKDLMIDLQLRKSWLKELYKWTYRGKGPGYRKNAVTGRLKCLKYNWLHVVPILYGQAWTYYRNKVRQVNNGVITWFRHKENIR